MHRTMRETPRHTTLPGRDTSTSSPSFTSTTQSCIGTGGVLVLAAGVCVCCAVAAGACSMNGHSCSCVTVVVSTDIVGFVTCSAGDRGMYPIHLASLSGETESIR